MMGGFRLLAACMIFVVALNKVTCECTIKENSSPHPYLVRIFGCNEYNQDWPFNNSSLCLENNTVAHGSLISADKVLTTCTGLKGPTRPGELTFRVYNSQDGCEQERTSLKYFPDKNCIPGDGGTLSFFESDYAMFIMDKPFDVGIKATLWRGQWGGISPPKLSDMESIITKMSKSKPSCKAALFSNASAVDGIVESDASVDYIDWDSCLSTLERIFPIDDDPVDKPLRNFEKHRLSCGRDKGISGFTFGPPTQIGNDWRSGAAVVCDVDGKKVPIGMFSRIVAPAPWAKTPSFRVTAGFARSFYDFLYDTAGIQSEPEENPDPEMECKLSGENYYPYLLRIVKEDSEKGFEPMITVGHGALIRMNMVLSSCTPYRNVPKDLKKENWMFWGYNPKKSCSQRRRPKMIYKPENCAEVGDDKILANDFAIWSTETAFDLDVQIHYPNLWQGPNKPSIEQVARSILELSDDAYVSAGVVSRRLSTGIFAEPKLLTGDRQLNADVEFVPWDECTTQLGRFVKNFNTISMESVADKQVYPVFCGYEDFRGTGSKSNKAKADWISGAVVMYSYLYVYESGEEPTTVTIPLGILSRVVVGQSEPDGKNIRVVSAFSKRFYDLLESAESEIAGQYSRKSSQPPRATSNLRLSAIGILLATNVFGAGTRSIHQ